MRSVEQQYELLALRLWVYGLDALDVRVVRTLARSYLHLEVRNLLRQHGVPESEINALTSASHPLECACWKCVIKLHNSVKRWTTGKKQREESRFTHNGRGRRGNWDS